MQKKKLFRTSNIVSFANTSGYTVGFSSSLSRTCTKLCIIQERHMNKNKNMRPMGLNGHTSSRYSMLTSLQKGLYSVRIINIIHNFNHPPGVMNLTIQVYTPQLMITTYFVLSTSRSLKEELNQNSIFLLYYLYDIALAEEPLPGDLNIKIASLNLSQNL